MSDFRGQRVQSLQCAGIEVSIRRKGRGSPLLYLHGVCADEHWLPCLEALARDHEVIAAVHPGFGGTPVPEWLAGTLDLGYFYQELVEALELERVHVIGVDLGGWVALEMAAQSTARIAAMTLVAPAGVHVAGASKADIFIVPPERFIKDLFVDTHAAAAHWALYQGTTEAQVDERLRNAATSARLAWQPYFYRPGLRSWLRRIKIPVQLLWGAADRMFAPAHAAAMAALLPRGKAILIDDCGHLPHIERADEFVGAVRRFAEETRS